MSFLWKWIAAALNYVWPWKRQPQVLFVGLDNAGKTTLFHMLWQEAHGNQSYYPPIHEKEGISVIGMMITVYGLAGWHSAQQRMWKDILPALDGVVFIVDAFDRDRFEEAKKHLEILIEEMNKCAAHMPGMLILGNKIDRPNAASAEELRVALGLCEEVGDKKYPMKLFMCSVVKRTGYAEGLKWLAQQLKTDE